MQNVTYIVRNWSHFWGYFKAEHGMTLLQSHKAMTSPSLWSNLHPTHCSYVNLLLSKKDPVHAFPNKNFPFCSLNQKLILLTNIHSLTASKTRSYQGIYWLQYTCLFPSQLNTLFRGFPCLLLLHKTKRILRFKNMLLVIELPFVASLFKSNLTLHIGPTPPEIALSWGVTERGKILKQYW